MEGLPFRMGRASGVAGKVRGIAVSWSACRFPRVHCFVFRDSHLRYLPAAAQTQPQVPRPGDAQAKAQLWRAVHALRRGAALPVLHPASSWHRQERPAPLEGRGTPTPGLEVQLQLSCASHWPCSSNLADELALHHAAALGRHRFAPREHASSADRVFSLMAHDAGIFRARLGG